MSQAIKEAITKLKAEREALINSVSALEAERKNLEAAYQKAQRDFYGKVDQIKAITHPRLYELDVEIAGLTRLLPTNRTFPAVNE